MTDRPCTCHPDDNPPVPCPKKYALSECRAAAPCIGNDPSCPCQDGDLCHYKDSLDGKTKAWAVSAGEVLACLQFLRTHLYAAQAQAIPGDDSIIMRHVYDAYKRVSDVCKEVELHGIASAPAEPHDNKADVTEPHPMLSATHYCKDCGALWRQNDDFSMSLRSANPCEACNNTPVGGQLFPLTEIPLPTMPPVSVRPFGYLKQTSSERNPPHGWAVHFNDGEVPLFTAQQMKHLRQEADRAWKEVDAIAKERDDHHRWRQELADDLGEVEKTRDVLARTVNDQERELGLLRVVRDAAADLCDDAEEYECEGLGLFAQHGSWEPLHDALDAVRPCTCHHDDNPPVPCPQRYALSECRKAAQQEPPQQSAEPVAVVIEGTEVNLDGKLIEPRVIDWLPAEIQSLPIGTKLYAAPTVDDEAVRLLRKARYMCDDSDTFTRMALAKAIDAYLAKAKC